MKKHIYGIFAYDREAIKYLDSNLELNKGIYVASISADGPARNSGLKLGDVIIEVDNLEINKMSELRNYIYSKLPGDTIVLTVNRNGKNYTTSINLGKR